MKDFLYKLADSVISGDKKQTLPLLKKNQRISKEKQLDVYIHGYRIRLSGAIKADHKAFCFYLRKKSEKLISDFIKENNSEFYSLDFYPLKFAAYTQSRRINKAAKGLVVLESAIAQVFLSKDSEMLKPEMLLTLAESDLDKFRFKARTASVMLEFNYDVEKYLQDFRADMKPKKIKKKKIYLYIVRNNNEIKRHYLLEEEYIMLKNLISGSSIDESIKAAIANNSNSENLINEMLPQWLQKWLSSGFFANL